MYRVSIKLLRAKTQKADYGYEIYPLAFRFIRFFSIYFTWILIQTRWKPNTISIVGVLFGALSGVMFVFGYVGAALTLVVLAIIADFSDGEVSRFHGSTSKEGTYLDSIHHFVVQSFFIGGVVLWGFESNQNNLFLAVGMLSVINSTILVIAVTGAVDNALLKHLLRHLNNNRHFAYQQTNVTANSTNTAEQKGISKFYRTAPGTIARMMDFPYVIFIMGFSAAAVRYDYLSVFNVNGKLLIYVIYIYGFLSTSMICVFIWHVVSSKHIERRLNDIKRSIHS